MNQSLGLNRTFGDRSISDFRKISTCVRKPMGMLPDFSPSGNIVVDREEENV